MRESSERLILYFKYSNDEGTIGMACGLFRFNIHFERTWSLQYSPIALKFVGYSLYFLCKKAAFFINVQITELIAYDATLNMAKFDFILCASTSIFFVYFQICCFWRSVNRDWFTGILCIFNGFLVCLVLLCGWKTCSNKTSGWRRNHLVAGNWLLTLHNRFRQQQRPHTAIGSTSVTKTPVQKVTF